MPLVTGVFFAVAISVAMQVLVHRACRRCPALAPWHPLLCAVAAFWCFLVLFKKMYLHYYMPPIDGAAHEEAARAVARLFSEGRYDQLLEPLLNRYPVGNPGYRLVLGVFYAITQAPEAVVYFFNAALAFWGLLSLLETLCKATGCRKAPMWAVLGTTCLPSALFWSTSNLKEGACLWGASMLISWTVRDRTPPGRLSLPILPLLGAGMLAFLRPHIAMLWIAGVGLTAVFRQRRVGVGLVCLVGIAVAFTLLKNKLPELTEELTEEGVVESLENRYEKTKHTGGSAITRSSTPIPVLPGIILLSRRPVPFEVFSVPSAMASLEITAFWMAGAFGWLTCRRRLDLFAKPLVLASVLVIICLSFYFTYMYNMGLMVRQRLMAYPAIVTLAVVPALAKRSQGRPVFLQAYDPMEVIDP